MQKLFCHLRRGLLDIIFPRNCLLCRTYHPATDKNPLCPSCQDQLPWNKHPVINNTTPSLGVDQTISVLHYSHAARRLLKQFKFQDKTSLNKTWNQLFKSFFEKQPVIFHPDTIIIPIPLHPTRLRERGYNQSCLLAQNLASILKLPLDENILLREKPTRPQSGLHRKERWTNLQSAFRIHPLASIVGKNIILVDDILTTGSTVNEAATTLKIAGALKVSVITLANVLCASCTTTSLKNV